MKRRNMNIPLIGILAYNRADLLSRCLNAIDHEADKIVLINNGHDRRVRSTISDFQRRNPNADVYHNKVGMGVAGSWNFIVSNYKTPFWFFLCSDIFLEKGTLRLLLEFTHKHQNEFAVIGGIHGMSYYFLTKLSLDKIGLFDENFYPAYFEDTDFAYRAKLAGAKMHWIGEAKAVHGEAPHWGSSTIMSDPILLQKNGITYNSNLEYYVRKWGATYPNETFTTPFNRPELSIREWVLDPKMRRRNSIWEEPFKSHSSARVLR